MLERNAPMSGHKSGSEVVGVISLAVLRRGNGVFGLGTSRNWHSTRLLAEPPGEAGSFGPADDTAGLPVTEANLQEAAGGSLRALRETEARSRPSTIFTSRRTPSRMVVQKVRCRSLSITSALPSLRPFLRQ